MCVPRGVVLCELMNDVIGYSWSQNPEEVEIVVPLDDDTVSYMMLLCIKCVENLCLAGNGLIITMWRRLKRSRSR